MLVVPVHIILLAVYLLFVYRNDRKTPSKPHRTSYIRKRLSGTRYHAFTHQSQEDQTQRDASGGQNMERALPNIISSVLQQISIDESRTIVTSSEAVC